MFKKSYYNLFDLDITYHTSNSFSKDLTGYGNPEFALTFKNFDVEEFLKRDIQEKWILDYLNYPDSFNMNSKLFRSDEFTNSHQAKHILFSGCSVTYGSGLYNQEIWPYLLYNKIKEKESLSGYYNLAIPGTGISETVSNIFKYINQYSLPDCIFINLTSLGRFYALMSNKNNTLEFVDDFPLEEINDLSQLQYYHAIYNYPNKRTHSIVIEKLIYTYQYLLMLEVFCKNNNIQLYTFSYNSWTEDIIKLTDLSSFNLMKNKNTISQIYEYHKNNPEDKFYMQARDDRHPGTAYHYIWAEHMYKKYLERNHVN